MIVSLEKYKESSMSAEILIELHHGALLCFAQPVERDVVEKIEEGLLHIHAFSVNNLMVARKNEYLIESHTNSFSHFIIGQVKIDTEQSVDIGGIKVLLDIPLPLGIVDGDWVQFNCERLDAY